MRQQSNQRGKPKIDPSQIKKILLIRLRRMGDIIMTTPAITALKQGCPQSSISYVVEKPFRELVEGNPNLDKVIVIPKSQGKKDFLNLLRQIRKENYDVVIDFHGGPRASYMTLFSKARLKIGYRIKYKNFIYDIKIPRSPEKGYIHSVENHIDLVNSLGINLSSLSSLQLPDAQKSEVEKIKNLLLDNDLEESKVIVLHIGAGNEYRDWGVDNIVKLTKLLLQKPDVKIVLIGSSEDQEAEKIILERSAVPLYSLVGKINLRELRELISQASLFVGPDSGPMHIAASTLTPIIAYFGPTLPAHFAPWQAKALIIEKDYECRPCKQRSCIHKDFRCLQTITPEEVYEACLNFL